MITNITIEVGPEDPGERLDLFTAHHVPTTTRAMAIKAIESQGILVNGRPAKKGHKLAAGDRIAIVELLEKSDWRCRPNPAIRLSILHEEEDFLVIDKPAGMPVHPLDPAETDTVANGLVATYPALAEVGPDPLFPAILHRLDTETSGVLLAARNPGSYKNLRRQFEMKKVTKRYVALVEGEVAAPGRLEHFLVHSGAGPHRMLVARDDGHAGKRKSMHAVTEYSPRTVLAGRTLLDITIYTGVTHQIRCQLSHIGHPIVGDRLYGAPGQSPERLHLHAAEIAFLHPRTGRLCSYQSPVPFSCGEFPLSG